jgi:fumarate reductase flavoprotein subunit
VADSTVFGGIAGDVMAEWVVGRSLPRLSTHALEAAAARIVEPLGRGEGEGLYPLQQRLRDIMWEQVGLVRQASGLKAALREIEDIGQRAPKAAVPGGTTYNLAWQDWLNLQNQAAAAWLIARSALERAESRGSHFRGDFPDTGAELYNIHVAGGDTAGLRVWREPTRLSRLAPDGSRQPTGVEVGD